MPENRYAIALDQLEDGVRVAPADQVAEHPERESPPAGCWRTDPQPYADGAAGDADGD
ncbi:hypothetical protein [Blastococcus capsensis]|uniref:hypothetical protein n=1 Tax=Blastococcus capsensis TaxID=1564163 RepID=UPI002542218F|nr:hypothetical protein [Blastococcus capsensis]MDK3257878.1 hypothetical protein [Blastococcus capsensis]